MGGKVWSAEEEKYFWEHVIPYSTKRVGTDRSAHREKDWTALAAQMQQSLGVDARRAYSAIALCKSGDTSRRAHSLLSSACPRASSDGCTVEHYFKNAVQKKFSPNAVTYVNRYLKKGEQHNHMKIVNAGNKPPITTTTSRSSRPRSRKKSRTALSSSHADSSTESTPPPCLPNSSADEASNPSCTGSTSATSSAFQAPLFVEQHPPEAALTSQRLAPLSSGRRMPSVLPPLHSITQIPWRFDFQNPLSTFDPDNGPHVGQHQRQQWTSPWTHASHSSDAMARHDFGYDSLPYHFAPVHGNHHAAHIDHTASTARYNYRSRAAEDTVGDTVLPSIQQASESLGIPAAHLTWTSPDDGLPHAESTTSEGAASTDLGIEQDAHHLLNATPPTSPSRAAEMLAPGAAAPTPLLYYAVAEPRAHTPRAPGPFVSPYALPPVQPLLPCSVFDTGSYYPRAQPCPPYPAYWHAPQHRPHVQYDQQPH